MSHLEQFVAFLDTTGVTYENVLGDTGNIVTTHDTSGTGLAQWKFDVDGVFEHVSHSSS